jgi:dolichol-phosphate mannosyltransferase
MSTGRSAQSLAVVVPFFNEEKVIPLFYEAACTELKRLGLAYSFVFVDDGSRDQTQTILNQLADHDPHITVLSFARNFGHQIALSAGLDYADGDVIVTMDGDLQHPPAAIRDLLAAWEQGADIVYGVRGNADTRSVATGTVAHVFYRVMKRFTRVEIVPDAKDFRLISRQALAVLRTMRERHRFLRGMVPWMGFRYATVPYEEQARAADVSRYGWRQLARLARHGLFSFSTVPLDFITLLGVGLTGLAALYLVFALVSWLAYGRSVPGWTSVIVVSLVIGGVQLISLGIIAQYVGMIFEEVKGRPLYVLKQERRAAGQRDSVHESSHARS